MLDEALADPGHGIRADLGGVGNPLVVPGRAARGGVGFEEDAGMSQLPGGGLAGGDQFGQLLAFRGGQRNLVLLVRQKQDRPSRERKLDGRAEARLIALACSAPPGGRQEWAMQLLADRLVELEVVDTVSDETVRRVLKKTRSSRG